MPEDMQKLTYDELTGGDIFFLKISEVLKGIIIFLVALALGSYYPILALLVLFIGYFSFTSEYNIYKPEEKTGGMTRWWLGFQVATVLFSIFTTGQVTSYGALLQFFLVFPLFDAIFSFIGIWGMLALAISIAAGFAVTFVPQMIGKAFKTPILIGVILGTAWLMNIMPKSTFGSDGIATLFFIALAFFAVSPERKGLKETDTSAGATAYLGATMFGNVVFAVLMFLAFADITNWAVGFGTGDFWSGIGFVISTIWFFAFLSGMLGGRSQRPYMGIIVFGMVMLLYTYSFTGAVGMTLFGSFWAPISQGVTAVAVPFISAFDAAETQMYCTQLFVTCPACYAADWKCQGGPPPTEAQNSTRAIELTNFQAINYIQGTSELDPLIPLIGTIEIENRGDFKARNIIVETGTLRIKDPEQLSLQEGLDSPYDSHTADNCKFTSCTGADEPIQDSKCQWTSEDGVIPGELKLLSFRCGNPDTDYERWSFYNDCVCLSDDTGEISGSVACGSSEPCGEGNTKTYEISSEVEHYMTIPIKYSYEYLTNVTLEIDVMNSSVFEQKLLLDEIYIQEIESKYSGGPVAIGLWTQKQPLRSGELSFGRIFISNDADGRIPSGNRILLKIPQSGGLSIDKTTMDFINNVGINCEKTDGSVNFTANNENELHISCLVTESLEKSKDKNYKDLFAFFQFKYNISDDQIQEKSSLWRASFDYTYSVTDEITDMPISGTVPQ